MKEGTFSTFERSVFWMHSAYLFSDILTMEICWELKFAKSSSSSLIMTVIPSGVMSLSNFCNCNHQFSYKFLYQDIFHMHIKQTDVQTRLKEKRMERRVFGIWNLLLSNMFVKKKGFSRAHVGHQIKNMCIMSRNIPTDHHHSFQHLNLGSSNGGPCLFHVLDKICFGCNNSKTQLRSA